MGFSTWSSSNTDLPESPSCGFCFPSSVPRAQRDQTPGVSRGKQLIQWWCCSLQGWLGLVMPLGLRPDSKDISIYHSYRGIGKKSFPLSWKNWFHADGCSKLHTFTVTAEQRSLVIFFLQTLSLFSLTYIVQYLSKQHSCKSIQFRTQHSQPAMQCGWGTFCVSSKKYFKKPM